MDELTRERYPLPRRKVTDPDIRAERRRILCGVTDEELLAEQTRRFRLRAEQRRRDARLVKAIRRTAGEP